MFGGRSLELLVRIALWVSQDVRLFVDGKHQVARRASIEYTAVPSYMSHIVYLSIFRVPVILELPVRHMPRTRICKGVACSAVPSAVFPPLPGSAKGIAVDAWRGQGGGMMSVCI